MCDVASLSTPELRALQRDRIARRLDADTAEDRARAGDDLILVAHETRRRDERADGRSGARSTGSGLRV